MKLGFSNLLALILITLKLCGVIDWGWEWVIACIWLPILAVAGGWAVWIVYKVFR
jgi:hypothetical protein